MKKNIVTLAFASILATTAADWAIDTKAIEARGDTSRANKTISVGEVIELDRDKRKIIIGHGTSNRPGSPAMTMVLKVASLDLLNALNIGDQVRCRVENIKGVYTVTAIETIA